MRLTLVILTWLSFCPNLSAQVAGVSLFKENGMMGVRNSRTKKIILPAEYKYIDIIDTSNFIVEKQAYGVFNSTLNKLVIPMEFDGIFKHSSLEYKMNGHEFMLIAKKGNKYGLLDQHGQYLLNCEYNKIDPSSFYFQLKKDGKSGVYFVDRDFKDLPLIYDNIKAVYGNLGFIANIGKHYFLFSLTGRLIVENCREITWYRDRSQQRIANLLLIVDQHGKCGLYDPQKNVYWLKVKYESLGDGFDNRFVVKKGAKYGVVAKGDKVVIPFTYDSLQFLFPRNVKLPLLAVQNKKFGLIDLTNKVVAEFKYDEIQYINDFYKAKMAAKYTVLNNVGKPTTDSTFDDVGLMYDGKMAVFNAGKIGYLDTQGNLVKPIERPSGARGYSDVIELFKAFEKAVKAESDTILMNFCRDVVYDTYTQEFFLRIHYQYRGFPNEMIKKNYTVEYVAKEYYKKVSRFYQELSESGQVQNFEFNCLKEPGFDYIDKDIGLRATETWGLFKTGSRNIEIKLGELIDCDGYWKSFTSFRWGN